VWLYPGAQASWHFLTVPKDMSASIKKTFGEQSKGWGSIPVKVTVGKTTWNTSIFPDRQRMAYLLPLKASVRKKEDISASDEREVQLSILLKH
jgi:hypothetical protein